MKTVIRFRTTVGGELDRIVLNDEDATTEAIARAMISMIEGCMSMHVGDIIDVIEEEEDSDPIARRRIADKIDGFDRDDLGESPDY
jgi:hypothetical protein